MAYTNENPAITINGIKIHNNIITNPAKITKSWNTMPTAIRVILINAPRNLENKLETSVLKNSATSYTLGYFHLYLCHGAKSDFNKIGNEK